MKARIGLTSHCGTLWSVYLANVSLQMQGQKRILLKFQKMDLHVALIIGSDRAQM